MTKLKYVDAPTEEDFPFIDRCDVCNRVTDWQPRYEMALRTGEEWVELAAARPLDYVPEARVVKICSDCVPDDNNKLRAMLRRLYPAWAKRKGI